MVEDSVLASENLSFTLALLLEAPAVELIESAVFRNRMAAGLADTLVPRPMAFCRGVSPRITALPVPLKKLYVLYSHTAVIRSLSV